MTLSQCNCGLRPAIAEGCTLSGSAYHHPACASLGRQCCREGCDDPAHGVVPSEGNAVVCEAHWLEVTNTHFWEGVSVGTEEGTPWWERHTPFCGALYRGCAPYCPKDRYERGLL